MTSSLELRLMGAPTPDGEIAVKDLAAISTALQDLVTRIGRDVVAATGPGRTKSYMEQFAQLRLSRVAEGSTVLSFSQGSDDVLDLALPEHVEAERRFWDVVRGIGEGRRPPWASDHIAESAGRLIGALQHAAPRSTLAGDGHAAVELHSEVMRAEVWATGARRRLAQAEAVGRLEKVDLRTHEFRLRDDVGPSVELRRVIDDVGVATHVGRWVRASGDGIEADGRLVALEDVSIVLLDDPAQAYVKDTVDSVESLLASAPGPDPAQGIELSDEDFAAFMKAARG